MTYLCGRCGRYRDSIEFNGDPYEVVRDCRSAWCRSCEHTYRIQRDWPGTSHPVFRWTKGEFKPWVR